MFFSYIRGIWRGENRQVVWNIISREIEIGRQEGTAVSDQRKTQKNHIRAARDWLGQAEHSLDHENDVQGDLKLMLAKAELSRVQASSRGSRLKCWGCRVIPAVIALVIAAGGWLAWQAVPHADPATVTGNETVLAGSHETAGSRATEPPVTQPAPDGVDSRPDETTAAAPAQTSGTAAVPVQQPAAVAELPHQPASQPDRPTVGRTPTPETQKLMQSAGKALRQ